MKLKECQSCKEKVPAEDIQKRHMNTAYVEEERNYMTSCTPCFDEMERNWADMWADYNSGRI